MTRPPPTSQTAGLAEVSPRDAPNTGQGRAVKVRAMLPNKALQGQLAWVVAPFALQQAARLLSSIVLARLLAPEIFGLMLLVNALRTGVELLSDIGIPQSVVRSPNADQPRFQDVAWTLQFVRGLMLAGLMIVAAYPIAELYGRPELGPLILAVAPIFILTGLQSPALFLIQRRMQLGRRAAYDIINTFVGIALTIALASAMPTVWALVIGLLVSTAFSTALTYVVGDRRLPRLAWAPEFVREIVSFGKWIFLSTAIYFAATSFDRMYFVAAVPIALAGVYGVARTFSDLFTQLAQRAGSYLVFPRAAAMGDRRDASTMARLRATRRRVLALVAMATGGALAVSDQFILVAYDSRYHAAAFMIPILFVGVWFAILSAFADSMLMGAGKPAAGAWANAAKFAVMLAGLPLALGQGEFLAALLVLVAAEMARWLALVPVSSRERLMTPLGDVALTLVLCSSALFFKATLGAIGLVPTLGEWWALRELIDG